MAKRYSETLLLDVEDGVGCSFCAGFNLKKIPPIEGGIDPIADHFRDLGMWWHLVLHKIVRIAKPALSAVNAAVARSGLGKALYSDLVVCSENARFCAPGTASGSSTMRLPAVLWPRSSASGAPRKL